METMVPKAGVVVAMSEQGIARLCSCLASAVHFAKPSSQALLLGAVSLQSLTREHKTSMSHTKSISVQMNKHLQPTYLYILKGGTKLAVWIGGRVLDWYEGSPGLKP